jgi:hypothetical protein
LLRTLGLGLGFLCVASVLRVHEEPPDGGSCWSRMGSRGRTRRGCSQCAAPTRRGPNCGI